MTHRWTAVPVCNECGDVMTENDDNDYECVNCDEVLYEYEINEN